MTVLSTPPISIPASEPPIWSPVCAAMSNSMKMRPSSLMETCVRHVCFSPEKKLVFNAGPVQLPPAALW